MSIKLMTDVWQLEINPTQKLVLLALADNANDSGVCWPSVSNIAEKSSLSERTVQRMIAELAKAGFLHIHSRHLRSNYYTVTPGVRMTPPVTASPPPVSPVHPPGVTVSPRIIIQPPIEPPKGLNLSAFAEWQAYRELKPGSIPAAQRKLAKFGDQQAEAVEHCIAAGYKGLFLPPLGKPSANDAEKRKQLEARSFAELTIRAEKVGFRAPLSDEDLLGYKTLVERAENNASRKGMRSVSDMFSTG